MTETASFTLTDQPDPVPAEPVLDPASLPPATTTALDRLKARISEEREQALKSLTFKLPVPRWDSVVVEYAAISSERWGRMIEMAQKTDMSNLDFNSRFLAQQAKAIYVKDDDGELISADLEDPSQPPPTFDKRLANSLGLTYQGVAVDMVKELYLTDGDIISTAAALLDLSGFQRAQEIEASVLGN
jgi:hypothetical protein